MSRPILIYDNLCTSCTSYAKLVDKLTNGQIQMLGHYTADGKQFKAEIFPKGYDGLEMSWFVDERHAYGGRQGLIKIIQFMLNPLRKGNKNVNKFDLSECTTDCRTVKGVMIRSCSILTEGKVIEIGWMFFTSQWNKLGMWILYGEIEIFN